MAKVDFQDPSHFGQVKLFDPAVQPWAENDVRGVLSWTGKQRLGLDPVSRSVLLSLDYTPDAADPSPVSNVWRWEISASVGGARRTFSIDAAGGQIIALPIDGIQVSLKVEGNPGAVASGFPSFIAPGYPVTASVYHAAMPVTGRSAVHTAFKEVAIGFVQTWLIPPGAVAWRPCGQQPNSPFLPAGYLSPFQGTVYWGTSAGGGGVVFEQWHGSGLQSSPHSSDGYLPLAPPVDRVIVYNNSVSPVVAGVQFAIDF